MKLCSLASSSSGNSAYLNDGNTNFLIDAGISKRNIINELKSKNCTPNELDAIFITHEHSDHIKGLGPLIRAFPIPVYLTEGTFTAIRNNGSIGVVNEELINIISPQKEYNICGISVRAVRTSHDALEPVAYHFKKENSSLAIVTDLGQYDDNLLNCMSDVDGCIIEANHDLHMLQTGRYPYSLKLRISGKSGHLSNDDCVCFVNELINHKLKKIILGHLSKENNYPQLAFETVKQGIKLNEKNILVAKPMGATEWIEA